MARFRKWSRKAPLRRWCEQGPQWWGRILSYKVRRKNVPGRGNKKYNHGGWEWTWVAPWSSGPGTHRTFSVPNKVSQVSFEFSPASLVSVLSFPLPAPFFSCCPKHPFLSPMLSTPLLFSASSWLTLLTRLLSPNVGLQKEEPLPSAPWLRLPRAQFHFCMSGDPVEAGF